MFQFHLLLNIKKQMMKTKSNKENMLMIVCELRMFQNDRNEVFEFLMMKIMMVIFGHFFSYHDAIEIKQIRYVVVDGKCCNISNNPNLKDLEKPVESSLIQYHLAPSSQF